MNTLGAKLCPWLFTLGSIWKNLDQGYRIELSKLFTAQGHLARGKGTEMWSMLCLLSQIPWHGAASTWNFTDFHRGIYALVVALI